MRRNTIKYFKILFRLCFDHVVCFCFIFLEVGGKTLLPSKSESLSISSTFDSSIHSIYDAVDAWCDDPISAGSTHGHISNWNTAGITDMSVLFSVYRRSTCSTFIENINDWDVSSVTNMEEMFREASSFNQPLDSWDVSSDTYMGSMFHGASSFNQPLDVWDVSSVTNMGGMGEYIESIFDEASSFEQC